jgi:hypothetical protein
MGKSKANKSNNKIKTKRIYRRKEKLSGVIQNKLQPVSQSGNLGLQKVKVLTAEYDQKSDTVTWTVELENGKNADLVWLRDDFGPSFNYGILPVEAINAFNEAIIGKVVNLQVEPKAHVTNT